MSSDDSKINSANANTLRLERALRDAAPPTGKSSKALEQLSTQEAPTPTDAAVVNLKNNKTLNELATYTRSSAKPNQGDVQSGPKKDRAQRILEIQESIKNKTYSPDLKDVASKVADALFS